MAGPSPYSIASLELAWVFNRPMNTEEGVPALTMTAAQYDDVKQKLKKSETVELKNTKLEIGLDGDGSLVLLWPIRRLA